MKLQSLVLNADVLCPVQIEISFLPGLPQIHFLGLPDQLIKESLFKIKSAFRASGFEFPKTHQIIVNIRPNHFKKSSRGLELAVALGILQATQQIQLAEDFTKWVIYGELSLDGTVTAPEDLLLNYDWRDENTQVLSGVFPSDYIFADLSLPMLSDWKNIFAHGATGASSYCFQRPETAMQMTFNPEQARFLKIMAWGGHSALLAGPAGAGKSTMAKALHALMPMPGHLEQIEIYQSQSHQVPKDSKGLWRPYVQPHHTSTPLSMVGGGVPPRKGEVSKAHRGLLVLDEFLEFHPRVQEALREPMEDGKIRIARSSQVKEFPAKAQYVGTTNLCPCGDWVPKTKIRCARSASKCRSYREKLSGPVLDRFQILFFCNRKNESAKLISLIEILNDISRRPPNWELGLQSRLDEVELLKRLDPKVNLDLFPWAQASYRRKLATLRVALTISELEGESLVSALHIEEAFNWTWLPHLALKNGDELTWQQNQTSLVSR